MNEAFISSVTSRGITRSRRGVGAAGGQARALLHDPPVLVMDSEGLYLNPAGVELGRYYARHYKQLAAESLWVADIAMHATSVPHQAVVVLASS